VTVTAVRTVRRSGDSPWLSGALRVHMPLMGGAEFWATTGKPFSGANELRL
jgi:hypothetical protein